jgi:DNA-binding CsgD family transcriptional regulator
MCPLPIPAILGFRASQAGRTVRRMTQEHAAHARRFERLANAPLDLATLPDQLLEALARVVPFDAFCWGAVDPASLLPTRATGTTIPCTTSLIWEVNELVARGVVPRDICPRARSGRYVARLSEVVDAQSEHSPVYERVLAPNGLEHQLRAALVVDGTHWGLLHIERRQPDFTSSEVALIDALVPHLANAFRRWILADPNHAAGTATPVMPGVIVLDQDNEVDSISPEAEHWLAECGFADLKIPPPAIAAVVGAARARADHSHNEIIPSARVRLPTGTWLHVRATHLTRPDRKPRTAIVLERASPDQVAPLIARAHQLSQRETQIALLVLRGLNTSEIASKLFISPYTVQDHLKSIFEKVGVRSRRELATDIFESHLQAAHLQAA